MIIFIALNAKLYFIEFTLPPESKKYGFGLFMKNMKIPPLNKIKWKKTTIFGLVFFLIFFTPAFSADLVISPPPKSMDKYYTELDEITIQNNPDLLLDNKFFSTRLIIHPATKPLSF